jgi:hypothetical protein
MSPRPGKWSAAADHDPGNRAVGRGFLGDQPHLAVVEQKRMAGLEGSENFRMRQLHARVVAGRLAGIEHEALAVMKLCRAFGERSQTQLWSLQIDENADRAAVAAFDIADGLDQFPHLVMRGVAHIDAKDVGAGLEQATDHRTV